MLAVNYPTVRKNLKDYYDQATDNAEKVIVTRKEEKNIVIMSLEKYNVLIKATKNTEYLEEQISSYKTVIKTFDKLEAMENE